MLNFTDSQKEPAGKLICKILPKWVCDELIAASEILDQRARFLAIRGVEERARRTYPRLFNAL